MSCFMLISHAMVTEGHLPSHTKILVKWVPENVPAMSICLLFCKYWLNHGLIRCLSNRLAWVDSSQCDLDHCESSRNICNPVLELSCCD